MDNQGNLNKNTALGEPYGTATNKLKKAIMFSLAKETGRDICFQCGEKIETVDEFSVEHKKPWLNAENPKEAFYSLDNIAFSHLHCNCKATGSKPVAKKGEDNGRAKLNWEKVREIRELLKTEHSCIKIAEQYRVGYRAIKRIRDNESWIE